MSLDPRFVDIKDKAVQNCSGEKGTEKATLLVLLCLQYFYAMTVASLFRALSQMYTNLGFSFSINDASSLLLQEGIGSLESLVLFC